MADITNVLLSLMGGGLAANPPQTMPSPIPFITGGFSGGSLPPVGGLTDFRIPGISGGDFTMPGVGAVPSAFSIPGVINFGDPRESSKDDKDFKGAQLGKKRQPGSGGPAPEAVPAEYRPIVEAAAKTYGVDPALIAAQIKQESSWNPNAINPSSGAAGLGQFMPATAQQYKVDPLNPQSAIYGVARYMADLLQRYGGNEREALAAYNGGQGAVNRLRAGAPYQETAQYLAAVQANLQQYRNQNQQLAMQQLSAVAPSPEGYVFPVVGYRGNVALHHGSVAGGSDIMAPAGSPVVAMRGGTVTAAGSGGPGGNWVQIQGDDGLAYYYAHFQAPAAVRQGQQVQAGQQIGAVGNTGNAASTPPHLHIGIGPSIVSGVGPTGGTGGDFNAVQLLRGALQYAASRQ